MLKCTLCQKDPTRIHDAPHETRKFYSMTSHVTYQHDMCVSQFKRIHIPAASWRKASRSSQMVDDECLRVDQTRENPSGGRPFTWSERKIIRAHGQSDTNGELAELPLMDQSKNADHIHAPRASAYSTNKNSHLLARDEYPEVVHAEKAAESGIAYSIPHIAPDVMVEWARKLTVNRPTRFYQMDPLSSPHELSPIYSEQTPIVWFTLADLKMFLRPSEDGLEEAWRKATTLLCFTIHILREACEFTDFRQTSFGSTYMAPSGLCANHENCNTLDRNK